MKQLIGRSLVVDFYESNCHIGSVIICLFALFFVHLSIHEPEVCLQFSFSSLSSICNLDVSASCWIPFPALLSYNTGSSSHHYSRPRHWPLIKQIDCG